MEEELTSELHTRSGKTVRGPSIEEHEHTGARPSKDTGGPAGRIQQPVRTHRVEKVQGLLAPIDRAWHSWASRRLSGITNLARKQWKSFRRSVNAMYRAKWTVSFLLLSIMLGTLLAGQPALNIGRTMVHKFRQVHVRDYWSNLVHMVKSNLGLAKHYVEEEIHHVKPTLDALRPLGSSREVSKQAVEDAVLSVINERTHPYIGDEDLEVVVRNILVSEHKTVLDEIRKVLLAARRRAFEQREDVLRRHGITLKGSLESAADWVRETATETVPETVEKIYHKATEQMPDLSRTATSAKQATSSAKESAKETVSSVKETAKGAVSSAKGAVLSAKESAQEAASSAKDRVVGKLPPSLLHFLGVTSYEEIANVDPIMVEKKMQRIKDHIETLYNEMHV